MLPRHKTNIAYLRLKRGNLSQRQVAEATGIGQKTISSLETGASQGIDFSTLSKLCEFFSCTPNDIFVLEDLDFSPEPTSANQAKKRQTRELESAPKRFLPELVGHEKAIYEVVSDEKIHEQTIIDRTGLPVPECLAAFTMLELDGLIQRHAGGYYTRK